MVMLAFAMALAVTAAPPSSKSEVDRTPPRVQAPRLSAPWLGLERQRSPDTGLVPVPGGGYRHEDRDGGFVAFIEPDGRVHFEPMPRSKLESSAGEAAAWGEGFVDALKGDGDRPDLTEHVGVGRMPATQPDRNDASRRAAAGMETVAWGPYGPGPVLLGLGFSFGPRVRRGGSKAQRDFLRRTQALRDEMALRARTDALQDATRQIGLVVVRIWKDDTVPLSIRKRRIFELWDDADPDAGGAGPLHAAEQAATTEIRARIERAIRRLAPAGSDDAYTTAELEELNAGRRSRSPFSPYTAGKRRRGSADG